jgi:hypothetical protein
MTVVLLHALGGESSQPLSLFSPVIAPTVTVVASRRAVAGFLGRA